MPARQHGFAVFAAIFVLVILAGLGAYMVSISTAQQVGVALDVQGGRALQAARSGLDWGIARVVNAPGNFGAFNCQTASSTVTVNLSTGGGGDLAAYSGMTVSVTCLASPYTDGTALLSYSLAATACNQPGAGGSCPNTVTPDGDYVERRVTAQVMCNANGTC